MKGPPTGPAVTLSPDRDPQPAVSGPSLGILGPGGAPKSLVVPQRQTTLPGPHPPSAPDSPCSEKHSLKAALTQQASQHLRACA